MPNMPYAPRGSADVRGMDFTPAGQALGPVSPFLGLLPPWMWAKYKDYFSYTLEFTPVAANGSAQASITIQQDSAFFILFLTATVTDTTNVTFILMPAWPLTLMLIDQGSGRNLSDKPVPLGNIAGTGAQPAILPMPKLLMGGTSVAGTLNNLDTVNAFNVRVTLVGFKIFSSWPSDVPQFREG